MNPARQNSFFMFSVMSAIILIALVGVSNAQAEPDTNNMQNNRLRSILKRMLINDLGFHPRETIKVNP